MLSKRFSCLAFLAARPANLYANVKIIINSVHAMVAPINTTLHQQIIQMTTFYSGRQLGGMLMWWGETISMPLSTGCIHVSEIKVTIEMKCIAI